MTSTPAKTALACLLAALAWPWVVGALAGLVMSPLDQAAQSAWCGMPGHAAFAVLGHCAVCWIGSAILIAVGMVLLGSDAAARPGHAGAPPDGNHFEAF